MLRKNSKENTSQGKSFIAILKYTQDASNEVEGKKVGIKMSFLILFQTRSSYTAKKVIRRVSLGLCADVIVSPEPDET